MLVYKAAQVVAVVKNEPKPWEMDGRNGVTYTAKLACFGAAADTATIILKGKTAEELDAKMKAFPIGKPAEVPVTSITPLFKQGQNKPYDYEYTS